MTLLRRALRLSDDIFAACVAGLMETVGPTSGIDWCPSSEHCCVMLSAQPRGHGRSGAPRRMQLLSVVLRPMLFNE